MDGTNSFNRVCSFCGESIAADYKRCPYCGSLLGLDKTHSGADSRDVSPGNENSIYKGARNILNEDDSIQKNTSNVPENEVNIPKKESNVWEGTSSIPKGPGYVREDEGGFSEKAVPYKQNINYGTAAGYEIKQSAANQSVYKNNTIAHSKEAGTSDRVPSMGNGVKVFLVTLSNLLPGIGQLIGVIAGIVFMNAEEDKDKKSFGRAILISSMVVFLIMMILFGLLAAYFA
ncbi:MAG TPA: hypothetical protein PLA01_09140 [Acetivibrio sp.]|nr:hypothetical protein [Acetivibrio sp.]